MDATADQPPVTLTVPDLGIEGVPVVVSLWLVREGAEVIAGDLVVELLAGGVTVDLESPVTGRLVRQLADEDDPVVTGMPLAEFLAVADA